MYRDNGRENGYYGLGFMVECVFSRWGPSRIYVLLQAGFPPKVLDSFLIQATDPYMSQVVNWFLL